MVTIVNAKMNNFLYTFNNFNLNDAQLAVCLLLYSQL